MKNTIKRNDYVTLNESVKGAYEVYPINTKCRVWTSKRDGTICCSPVDENTYNTFTLNKNQVTKVESPKANVKVNDIFVTSWGYDQTNVDFYIITAVKNKSVIYRSLDSNQQYTGPLFGRSTPVIERKGDIDYMSRINVEGDGRVSFKVNSFKYANPWNGTPMHFSEYH